MRKKRTFRLKVDRKYTMDDTYICLFLNGICSSRCTFNEDGDICEGDLDDRPHWCPLVEAKDEV